MRAFWHQPWGFPQATMIASGLFAAGAALDAATGGHTLSLPPFPGNIAIATCALIPLLCCGLFLRDHWLARFFGSIPVTISACAFLGVLVIFAGILPQGVASSTTSPRWWFSRVVGSWPFVLALLLFVTNLALAWFRRLGNPRLKDWWFHAVHGGLLITVVGMTCGASDIQRLRMITHEGQLTRSAYWAEDFENRYPVKMPFGIFLHNFRMEEYPPRLALLDRTTGEWHPQARKRWIDVADAAKGQLGPWQVSILRFLPAARKVNTEWVVSETAGSSPAVLVRLNSAESPQLPAADYWLGFPAPDTDESWAILDQGAVLKLIPPDPKKFQSEIEIVDDAGKSRKALLEVNKPVYYAGWYIYQSSYDSTSGKFSRVSILEVSSDPWLPVVYLGVFLTLLGVLRLFWMGAPASRREVE